MRQPGIGSERHSRPFRLLIPHGRPTLLCLPRSASSAGGPNPLSRGRARPELRRVLATEPQGLRLRLTQTSGLLRLRLGPAS